jgi:hypothetical protein
LYKLALRLYRSLEFAELPNALNVIFHVYMDVKIDEKTASRNRVKSAWGFTFRSLQGLDNPVAEFVTEDGIEEIGHANLRR